MTSSSGADARPSAPLLSVVIPTRDVRTWIRQTLDSVREQDVDMEIIVVDDRSSDGTREYVDEVAREDPRVRVLSAEVPGGGSARNAGAGAARGEFLIFCDGDDIVPPGAYRALADSLARTGSDIAFGDYLKFRAADTWRPTDPMPAFDEPRERTTLAEHPSLLFSRPCWNKAFRLAFWREAGIAFPDVPRSNDIRPMVEAYLAADRVDVVDEVVYLYRERPGAGSMTARAVAAESLVSYLTQEAVCAALIAARGDRRLDEAYAELVWVRDGFVALARWARLAERDADADAAVSGAVRRLRSLVADPSEADPLRLLLRDLVAEERFEAARVVADAAHDGHPPHAPVPGADAVAGWGELLDALAERAPLPESATRLLVDRLARLVALRDEHGRAGAGRDLAERAHAAFGPRAVMFAPDWRTADEDADARVERIDSGDIVVVAGSAAIGAPVEPGLWDAETGEGRIIRPLSVTRGERDGRATWEAAYAPRSLPLHRPLVPVVIAEGGRVQTATGEAILPRYRPTDPALFDAAAGVTTIRRRRHWTVRGAKRAAERVLARL